MMRSLPLLLLAGFVLVLMAAGDADAEENEDGLPTLPDSDIIYPLFLMVVAVVAAFVLHRRRLRKP